MNKLLLRQIKRHFGSVENVPKELERFLEDIGNSYKNFDDDIYLLQNSIEISSLELREAFQKHKQDADKQKNTISKVKEVINAIRPNFQPNIEQSNDSNTDSKDMLNSLLKIIEEKQEAEKEIRKLSLAVEQNPASIVITDINGDIEYVNAKFCELTGYSREESIGKNPRILKTDKNDDSYYRNLWKTILSGEEWKGEFLNKKKNGELYWEFASISAVKNEQGETVNYLAIKEDITKRKQTEETLENERALFRTIIDLIPDAVYVKNVEGRKILANPTDVKFSGKNSEEEVIGKTDAELYPSEQATISYQEDFSVLDSGTPILNKEGTLTDSEGQERSLLVSKVPLYDLQHTINGLVGVTHDITESKQAKDTIQRAHKSLADILNAAKYTSIIATDTEGIIKVFSLGAEKMLGYTSEELVDIATPGLFHLQLEIEERAEELSKELGREVKGFDVFTAKAKIQEFEERTWIYVRKNKTAIYVNLIVSAIRDTNNTITGYLGIANNITERKEAEEEVRRVSTRLALATFAGGVGVWDYDIIENKLIWDNKMYELYRIKNQENEIYYDTWLAAIHLADAERVNEEIQLAIKGEKDFDTEFQISWLDGSIHNIRALATVQRNQTGKSIRMIGTNWDITEQKNNEKILLKARQEAESANNAKSEFLANVSHEIRTPMNAILGFAEILRDKISEPKLKEHVKTILSSGRTLLSLINDILDLSKIEAGRLDVEFEVMHYESVIKDIEQLFAPKIQNKGLSLEVIINPEVPEYIYMDEVRFHQVLLNLVGNAIKFTQKGYIRIETKAKVTKDKGLVDLIIEIEDTGIGIPNNQLILIFDAFTQQSGQSNRKFEGTGLGLAISKRLIEKMNGSISIESRGGRGSLFKVIFHSIQVAQKTEGNQNSLDQTEREIHFQPATVMVVDDIYYNIEVIQNMLDFTDKLNIISASSGEEALEVLELEKPDIIFMDIRMSGMSGVSATELIKATDSLKNIPVIAFTASAVQSQIEQIYKIFDGYVRKPLTKKQLINTLKEHLKFNYGKEILPEESKNFLGIDINEYCKKMDPLVMQILEGEIYEQWKEISGNLIIFEIEQFCDNVDLVGTKYNCPALNIYASRLRNSVQSFDVELIEKNIKEFEELKTIMKTKLND